MKFMLKPVLAGGNSLIIPANKQVKRIGQYLYRHIDGAYDYRSGSNEFDIYFLLLFELKKELREPDKDYPVEEMHIDINVTTYSNKIRINLTEISPMERTIGFDLYDPSDTMDLQKIYPKIMDRIYKRIYKAYEDYYFVY